MEENMTNEMIEEIDVTENETEIEATYDEPEEDSGLVKVMVIGGIIGGGLLLVGITKGKEIVNKTKEWIDKCQVKRLEKRGYVIFDKNDVTDDEEECLEVTVEESNED